ncbi:hypothetical protein ACQP2K_08185 [Microbispora siamensis]
MAGVAVGFEACGVPGCRRSESGRHAGGRQGGVCGHGLTIEGTDGAGEADTLGAAVTEPVGDAVAEIAGDWLGEGSPYDT